MSGRLTAKDWDDVADLCGQCADACETGYEEHTRAARDKATEWMHKIEMRAHCNARSREAAEMKPG